MIEAATCTEAKQVIHKYNPSLVVLDIDLPDGNGFEMAKEWRENGQASLPILFISGREHSSCQIKASQLNDYFLPKPFSPDDLLAAADSLLGSTKLA